MSPAKFAAPASTEKALGDRLAQVIRKRSAGNPRSKQSHVGPSEIGEKCVRRLSYRLLGWDKQNDTSDPWPSVSGTAIHSWLADCFTADTTTKWLTEHRVKINGRPGGSLDLFDIDNGIVIDHKCVGATSMKARKAEGPTEQQIIQLNMYGLGLEQEGYTVNKIALAFYPLGGMLTGLHTWVGDYDREIAQAAIERLDNTQSLVLMLDPEANPERWGMIPATPSRGCSYCPWFIPNSQDLSKGCAGESS